MAAAVMMRKKVVVVGDGACGKTCLLMSFKGEAFIEDHVPTALDNYMATIDVRGKQIQLFLWDTAGQEEYDRLRPLSYPNTDVFILCFSVDNADSFLNIQHKWAPEVRQQCPGTPFVLVGTKSDLRTDEATKVKLQKAKRRFISAEEGQEMAKKIHAFEYHECSAKTRHGVQEAFASATKAAFSRRRGSKDCVCM